jgi:hypothetical protein
MKMHCAAFEHRRQVDQASYVVEMVVAEEQVYLTLPAIVLSGCGALTGTWLFSWSGVQADLRSKTLLEQPRQTGAGIEDEAPPAG